MTTEPTTALEKKPGGTPPMITRPDEYLDALKRWTAAGFHVLTPFTNLTGLAERHALIASMVTINTDVAAAEVYDGLPFLETGEVAIAKLGLRKIAECGAISTTTTRTDPRTIPSFWEFKAIARYRSIDGSIVTREATAEWDLRDGSPRLKGWKPKQVEEGRKNGARNCETRAINAAIREFGVKQKYGRDELAKPFVVIRVAYQPDMSDPLTRQIVTSQALAGTGALYGSRRALPEPEIIDVEPVPETVTTTKGPKPGQGEGEPPALPAGYGVIQKLSVVNLARKNSKSLFPKWTVVDFTGVEHVTIQADFGAALERCHAAKTPVEIVSEENAYQENAITEITPWTGAQPALPVEEPKL